MTLVLNGDISRALGFLLAGVYGSTACMLENDSEE
jgi:hypothetical protein